MRVATLRSHSPRGATMLYVTGLSAVMFIMCFGMADAYLRAYKRTEHAKARVEAEWIARAGLVYAKRHMQEMRSNGTATTETRCGAGVFSLRIEKDPSSGQEWLISSARVPPERPRATAKLRQPFRP